MPNVVNVDPPFWSKTSWIQLGYGVWTSLTVVNIGLATGFPAVTIPQLLSAEDMMITTSDESWIASILTLVAPAGCLICGVISDRFGRRIILVISQIPMLAGWIYTGYASTAKEIIIGRVMTGFGCGMSMSIPRIYSTEISLPNMRGMIGAFPSLAMSVGLTCQAILGTYLQFNELCFACGLYTILLGIFNCLLPESPHFVLLKSSEHNARASLKKFRSRRYDVDAEMVELMEYQRENDLHRLSMLEQIKLLFTKAACKPFCFILIYFSITQFAGVSILFIWTIDFLESSKSSINANTGNIALGVTRFLSGILSSFLLYKVGRRPQALISSFGLGLVCLTLGSMIHYKSTPTVIPQICYVIYIMFATIGYYTLPLLLMAEVFPLQIRGLLSGISLAVMNFMIFGVNYAFPYLRNAVGHANVILGFGVSSILGTVFLYFYLPETKGLTLQEIEEYFNGRRPTLVSQRKVQAAQMNRGRFTSEDQQAQSTSRLRHKMSRKNNIKDSAQNSDSTGPLNEPKNSEDSNGNQNKGKSEK